MNHSFILVVCELGLATSGSERTRPTPYHPVGNLATSMQLWPEAMASGALGEIQPMYDAAWYLGNPIRQSWSHHVQAVNVARYSSFSECQMDERHWFWRLNVRWISWITGSNFPHVEQYLSYVWIWFLGPFGDEFSFSCNFEFCFWRQFFPNFDLTEHNFDFCTFTCYCYRQRPPWGLHLPTLPASTNPRTSLPTMNALRGLLIWQMACTLRTSIF